MICHICTSPARHFYSEGAELLALCDPCDRAGAEDAPMESGFRVAFAAVLLVLVGLALYVVGAA